MTEIEQDDLQDRLSEYTEYVNKILSQIQDFDVWHETIKGLPFPVIWYEHIRNNNADFKDSDK